MPGRSWRGVVEAVSKGEFFVERVSRERCCDILRYHYLGAKGFRSGYNYGLFRGQALLAELVGVCIFTIFPVPELAVGLFGLPRNQQDGLWELSRLCVHPDIQETEHNITSWFVARSVKRLRNETTVRAILAYADSEYHAGIVYRALNFGYYGLTDPKPDFWFDLDGGGRRKHNRGPTKGARGIWEPRTRKHRYLMVYDKTLTPRWEQVCTNEGRTGLFAAGE